MGACGSSKVTEAPPAGTQLSTPEKSKDRPQDAKDEIPKEQEQKKSPRQNRQILEREKSSKKIHRNKHDRTVRVFISSTFRDFGLERDYLMRHALPALRTFGDAYGVTVVFVDLRWGVTADEANNGLVVKLCLQEIDACRPYFVGMLGNRYGWHLTGKGDEELLNTTMKMGYDEYPWVKEYTDRSVTELEIYHGAIRNTEDNDLQNAFFYFRDTNAFVNQYKDKILDSGAKVEDFDTESPYADEKQTGLKELIRETRFPVHDYVRLKDLSDRMVEDLKNAIRKEHPEDLASLSHWERVANQHKAFGQTRIPGYVKPEKLYERLNAYCARDEPVAVIGPSGRGKSALLANWSEKYRIDHREKAEVFVHYVGATAESTSHIETCWRIMGDLVERLEIPESMFELPDSEAENREIIQATEHLLECARDHLQEAGKHLLVVIDALDQFDDEDRALNLSWLRKVRGVRLVCSIQDTVNENQSVLSAKSSISTISSLQDKRSASFSTKFAARHRVKDCWINKGKTTKRKQRKSKAAGGGKSPRDGGWGTITLRSLDVEERKQLVHEYLTGVHGKKLDEKQLEMVLGCRAANNPLYLRTLLDEARLFGNFFLFTGHLETLLQAKSCSALFLEVLKRIAKDSFDHGGNDDFVNKAIGCILCARDGITDEDLQNILDLNGKRPIKFTLLLSSLREQLCSRSGMMRFFHDSVKRAVVERLRSFEGLESEDADLSTIAWAELHHGLEDLTEEDIGSFEVRCHWKLAEYFGDHESHSRMMREYPHHLAKSKQFACLAAFLSDDDILAELLHGHGKNDLREYWEYVDNAFQKRTARREKHETGRRKKKKKKKDEAAQGEVKFSALDEANAAASVEDFLGSIAAHKAKGVRSLEAHELNAEMAKTAEQLGNIASLLEMLGKYDKTIEIRREEIAFLETSLGADHETVGIVCSRLGKTYEVVYGNYERALEMKQRALEIDIKTLGETNPKLAVSYDNLAMLQLKVRCFILFADIHSDLLCFSRSSATTTRLTSCFYSPLICKSLAREKRMTRGFTLAPSARAGSCLRRGKKSIKL